METSSIYATRQVHKFGHAYVAIVGQKRFYYGLYHLINVFVREKLLSLRHSHGQADKIHGNGQKLQFQPQREETPKWLATHVSGGTQA